MNFNPNNPLFQQMFGGFNNFNTAFTNFANNPMFRNPGTSPQQWPMSYGDESYRRGRNAMGQFTRQDSRPMMGDNYSGHSFNDRLIANLESMMAEAPSEEDRMKLHEEIDRLRRNPR